MAADGRDGSAAEGTMDGRGSLDVPEWVSELRRLYVEPKTRAKLRQEGVIAPQKRRLGLPSGRGSRRGATDAPGAPVSPAASAPGAAEEQADRAVAVPAPVAPDSLRPAVLEPADTTPLLDESGAPYTPPDRSEEDKVATFLTTYLVATGHATGDEPAPAEPDTSTAVDPHREPGRAVPDGAGVLLSTGGDAATPNPAVTTTSEPDLSPAPDVSDASGSADSHSALADPQQRPEEIDEGPVEPVSAPGRPSTVPAVTLSWREAKSFEIGVPDAEDSERAIVVEPPSQLVAQRRGRRRDIETEDDTTADPVVVEPLPASALPEEAPATRASARAASGYPSGKRRRAMVVGLVLVMLAVVAWYFLLRGDGDDSATGATSSIGGYQAAVALPPSGPGCAPVVSLV